MLNLYSISVKNDPNNSTLTDGEMLSIIYHDIFDYPLDFFDLIKWRANDKKIKVNRQLVAIKEGHAFLAHKEGLVYKKLIKLRTSQRKMVIAKKVANILSFIPTVKMVGITGSLAMNSSTEDSDIDFLVVTSKNKLWTTRLIVMLILKALGVSLRRSLDNKQEDKICLNMWMDEDSLAWKKDKNFYTAHEIAQIKPLVNKDTTYDKLLFKNKWILDFWPNSVKIKKNVNLKESNKPDVVGFVEKIFFQLQYKYMKNKITNEYISMKKAFFHPNDWSKMIIERLSS